jgi:HSP20 family protein
MNITTYKRTKTPSLFNNFFNDFMTDFIDSSMERYLEQSWPKVNIEETEKDYKISAELPGIEKEAINVEFNNNVLTITGEKKEEKEEKEKTFHKKEMFTGKFSRSFSLPDTVDAENIKAEFKNGVLELNIPKTDNNISKKIEIK